MTDARAILTELSAEIAAGRLIPYLGQIGRASCRERV